MAGGGGGGGGGGVGGGGVCGAAGGVAAEEEAVVAVRGAEPVPLIEIGLTRGEAKALPPSPPPQLAMGL